MTVNRRGSAPAAFPLRFLVLLLVGGAVAFLLGTRVFTPIARPEHALSGRTIPGMATDQAWMERAERDQEEAPDRALTLIGIAPGMNVADVGAGTGYFTVRIAALVGPNGLVYANEIQPAMLRRIEGRVREQQLSNVRLVRGSPDDSRLPANAIDVALLVDVYHELQQPQMMLRSIRRALRIDGRLVLIEYRQEDPAVPIAATHRMSVAGLQSEIEPEGFVLHSVVEGLPRQHIVIFRKSSGA